MAVGKGSILRAAQSIEKSKTTSEEVKKDKTLEMNAESEEITITQKTAKESDQSDGAKETNKQKENKAAVVELEISRIKGTDSTEDEKLTEIKILELKKSVEKYGMIIPLVVREVNDNSFQIVDGDKRLKAAKLLKWKKVNCIVIKEDAETSKEIRKELEKFRYDYNNVPNKDNFKRKYEVVSVFGKDMPDYLL